MKSRKRKRRPQKRPPWSREDLRLLLRLHGKTPNVVIARRLGRTLQGITSKAHKLGLMKDLERLVTMGQQNMSLRWGKKRRRRRLVA